MFHFNYSVAFSTVSLLVLTCATANKNLEGLKNTKLLQVTNKDTAVVLDFLMVVDTIALTSGEKEKHGFAVSNAVMETFLQRNSISNFDDYDFYYSYSEDGKILDPNYKKQPLFLLKNCVLLTPNGAFGRVGELSVGIFQKDASQNGRKEKPDEDLKGRVIQAWVDGKDTKMVIVERGSLTIEEWSSREVWTIEEGTNKRGVLLDIFTKKQDVDVEMSGDELKAQRLQASEFYLFEPALEIVEVESSDSE